MDYTSYFITKKKKNVFKGGKKKVFQFVIYTRVYFEIR